jgi:hypothetical protein
MNLSDQGQGDDISTAAWKVAPQESRHAFKNVLIKIGIAWAFANDAQYPHETVQYLLKRWCKGLAGNNDNSICALSSCQP